MRELCRNCGEHEREPESEMCEICGDFHDEQLRKSVAERTIDSLRNLTEHMERGELPPGTRVTTVEMMPDGTIQRTSKVVES